jgi:hypothetical protein
MRKRPLRTFDPSWTTGNVTRYLSTSDAAVSRLSSVERTPPLERR